VADRVDPPVRGEEVFELREREGERESEREKKKRKRAERAKFLLRKMFEKEREAAAEFCSTFSLLLAAAAMTKEEETAEVDEAAALLLCRCRYCRRDRKHTSKGRQK